MADLPIKPAETPVTPVETPDIVVPPSVESARAPVEVPRESAPVVEAVVSEPEPEPREPVA
ncbi:cell wall protein, partial [bacterium]|nr:cell wall protein [bacterium]